MQQCFSFLASLQFVGRVSYDARFRPPGLFLQSTPHGVKALSAPLPPAPRNSESHWAHQAIILTPTLPHDPTPALLAVLCYLAAARQGACMPDPRPPAAVTTSRCYAPPTQASDKSAAPANQQ